MLQKLKLTWKAVRWPLVLLLFVLWALSVRFGEYFPQPILVIVWSPFILLYFAITMPEWTMAGHGIFLALIAAACFLFSFALCRYLPRESRGLAMLSPILCYMIGLSSWYLISRCYMGYYSGVIQWITLFWICLLPALLGLWVGILMQRRQSEK